MPYPKDTNETGPAPVQYPRTPAADGSGFQKPVYRYSGGENASGPIDDTGRKITQAIMAKDIPNSKTPTTPIRAADGRTWVNGKLTTGHFGQAIGATDDPFGRTPGAGGGGGGTTHGKYGGAPGTAGKTGGWPAGLPDNDEPQMSPGQYGFWTDITAATGYKGTWPLVLAAPVTITVNMSDGTTKAVTLPAKSYPDASATDGGSQAAANGLAWQLVYEPSLAAAGLAGTMPYEDTANKKLYLRLDALADATHKVYATGGTAADDPDAGEQVDTAEVTVEDEPTPKRKKVSRKKRK